MCCGTLLCNVARDKIVTELLRKCSGLVSARAWCDRLPVNYAWWMYVNIIIIIISL